MSRALLDLEDVDGYGDSFAFRVSDPEDASDELDLIVACGSDAVVLGLSLDQVQEISEALRFWIQLKYREEVQRVRGSLS